MDLSIIIVHYNTPHYTRRCLKSIYQHTSGISFEVIVVDNGSTSGSVDTLIDEFPDVKFIVNPVNLGFAGGNNLGVKAASGRYYLLLNSDTFLIENALCVALRFLENNPHVGAVSAKLIFPDGKLQSVAQRFPSVWLLLFELLRLQKLISRRTRGHLLLGSYFDGSETIAVDWVWGAFFMFPATVYYLLPDQKLDDTYFLYYEDVQWCKHIKDLGFSIYYLAEVRVVHEMGGSLGEKEIYMQKNARLFLQRNYAPLQAKAITFLQRLLA